MPFKIGENITQYKQRVIDPLSPTFCGAKWYDASILLASGLTASCHHPSLHAIDEAEIKKNPKALHNTKHKKEMRRLMQEGVRPAECEYCWKIEDIQKENISDRVLKTSNYSDVDLKKAFETGYKYDVNLKTLEISFDRICNFACSYCSPGYSTTWVKDIKLNGPYTNLKSNEERRYAHTHDNSSRFKNSSENPFVTAFWEWWPELSQSLNELRITGGEPLMSPQVWRLLDYFANNKMGNMALAINSNLGSPASIIEKFIKKTLPIRSLHVSTSCEGIGQVGEYIRDGLNFELWKENIENLLGNSNIESLGFMMTINALCLFSLTDFLDLLLHWKEKYPRRRIFWTANILRYPAFQGPLVLPDWIKHERRNHLENWLKKNISNPLINGVEKVVLERLVDYLDVVKIPHSTSSPHELLRKDFKSFYGQYDNRRGKNFSAVFPKELVDWMNSIES